MLPNNIFREGRKEWYTTMNRPCQDCPLKTCTGTCKTQSQPVTRPRSTGKKTVRTVKRTKVTYSSFSNQSTGQQSGTTQYYVHKEQQAAHNAKARRQIVSDRRSRRKVAEQVARDRRAFDAKIAAERRQREITFEVPQIAYTPAPQMRGKPAQNAIGKTPDLLRLTGAVIQKVVVRVDNLLKKMLCNDLLSLPAGGNHPSLPEHHSGNLPEHR